MEIRTARGEKTVLIGYLCILFVLIDRVAAGDDYDSHAAEPAKFVEQGAEGQRIELVANRMGIDRHAAGVAYPADRLLQTGPAMRHIAWLALDQVIGKHFKHNDTDAALDQESREMRARNQVRIADEFKRAIESARNAGGLQLSRHLARAPLAPGSRLRQSACQRLIGFIDIQTDDMQGFAGPGDRNLDPADIVQP